ncbi:MAG: MFS transporter [Chloroflexi bacterium]|nr:MFS transporter [Chloroflexota bacterium]
MAILQTYLISFGVVKAITNLFAGRLGNVNGRKRILIAGWLIGLPIPFILIFAPAWGWIIFAKHYTVLGSHRGNHDARNIAYKANG